MGDEERSIQISEKHDSVVEQAKGVLLAEVFNSKPDEVFYLRQLQVMYERKYFHWIVNRALNSLVDERKIKATIKEYTSPKLSIKFYWNKSNRYWARKAKKIEEIVLKFSNDSFARSLGVHAEVLFDSALFQNGFLFIAKNVSSYNGVSGVTKHNLDRVYRYNGVDFGVEIKNKLGYIEFREFQIKLKLCEEFGIRPLFIQRALPTIYTKEVIDAGGFALIFQYQLYPFGQEAFAKEVRETLGITVDSPKAIYEGTILRFTNWFNKREAEGGFL